MREGDIIDDINSFVVAMRQAMLYRTRVEGRLTGRGFR